jgi:hypothetical protein
MVLQGNFIPVRAAKHNHGGTGTGAQCNIPVPDKDPPCSTRYLFRFRPDRPERICREFSCMCQDRLPPVRLSGRFPDRKNIQLPAGPAPRLLQANHLVC